MPGQSTITLDTASAAILTPSERKIAGLWAEFLAPSAPLKPTDNFFSLGGDSLAMTMVLFRIKEELGVDLPPATLLESPELRAFCTQVDLLLAYPR